MFKTVRVLVLAGAFSLSLAFQSSAETAISVDMHLLTSKGVGKSIGVIRLSETKNGFLRLDLNLTDELSPGGHGFHVHENDDCGPGKQNNDMVAGLAAGGHFDPLKTGQHEGPSGRGHLGDLPILFVEVDEDGAQEVTHSLIAPRLKLSDVRGRSLVVHANSDNFSDEPKPLGGGGARIACGAIPK